jgi:glycosyltransferase involved in cell wall biosynthesis
VLTGIPLISVIIPTYNREREIFRALDSVFEQNYRPIEIIVADDCSTDGTVAQLSNVTFPLPVQVVALPTNQGPSAARNAALARATGKYVAFLDSDDHWLPNKLKQQVVMLESGGEPENTVLFSQAYIRRRYDTVIRPRLSKCLDEPLDEYLFVRGGYIPMCSVILATALAQRIAFKSDLSLHEDWDFFLRIAQQGGQFVLCPQPLCVIEDESPVGRASSPRPALSLAWLESWKDRVSSAAYLAMRAHIAPQLRNEQPFRALSFILEAWGKGAIGLWPLLVLIGRLLHPGLRVAAYWLQGHFQRVD